ncbi:MAG: hypothetical protein Q9171_004726 [Xanthocarpia ochracea]
MAVPYGGNLAQTQPGSPQVVSSCVSTESGNGVWIENGQPTTIKPDATQATTVFATPISATAPADLPPPPPQSTGLAGGAIAGIAVGAIAGTIIAALAIWLYILRPRKRRRDNIDAKDASYTAPQPVDGHGPLAEMNAPNSTYLRPELDHFKGDPSMYPYAQEEDGALIWEVCGHNGQDVPPAELVGEDPARVANNERGYGTGGEHAD